MILAKLQTLCHFYSCLRGGNAFVAVLIAKRYRMGAYYEAIARLAMKVEDLNMIMATNNRALAQFIYDL